MLASVLRITARAALAATPPSTCRSYCRLRWAAGGEGGDFPPFRNAEFSGSSMARGVDVLYLSLGTTRPRVVDMRGLSNGATRASGVDMLLLSLWTT
jgi:hypothetical protein